MKLVNFLNKHNKYDGMPIYFYNDNILIDLYNTEYQIDIYNKIIKQWYFSPKECCIIVELEED